MAWLSLKGYKMGWLRCSHAQGDILCDMFKHIGNYGAIAMVKVMVGVWLSGGGLTMRIDRLRVQDNWCPGYF